MTVDSGIMHVYAYPFRSASLNFLGLSTMDIFYLFSKDNKHYCNSDILNSKTQSD